MIANLDKDTTVVGYQFQINYQSSYHSLWFLFGWSLFLFDRCFYLQKTHFEHTWSLEIIYSLILLLCVVVPTQVVVLHFFNSSCRSLSGLINKELSSQQQNSNASAIKKTIADDILVWKSGYQEIIRLSIIEMHKKKNKNKTALHFDLSYDDIFSLTHDHLIMMTWVLGWYLAYKVLHRNLLNVLSELVYVNKLLLLYLQGHALTASQYSRPTMPLFFI